MCGLELCDPGCRVYRSFRIFPDTTVLGGPEDCAQEQEDQRTVIHWVQSCSSYTGKDREQGAVRRAANA